MLPYSILTRRLFAAVALLLLLSCGGDTPGTTEPSDNPVPVLSGLSRDTATGGIPLFSITLRGSGFMPGAMGTVDGSARTTTIATDSTAQLTFQAADLASAGPHLIRLKNPDPTEGPSAPLNFTVLAAPVPTIDSISPDTLAAGAPNFTLHVYGAGFLPQSVIKWNALQLATTRVDGTHLFATVAASLVAAPGSSNVTVFTPAPGGGTSTQKVFLVPPLPVVTGIDPDTIVVGPDTIPLTVFGHGFGGADSIRIENQAHVRWYPAVTSTDSTVLIALDRTWLSALGLFSVQVVADAGTSGYAYFETVNPVPVATSITPDTLDGSKTADTLVITGSGFVQGMAVRLVGFPDLPTTYLDYNHLRAVVSSDLLVYGGMQKVVVNDPLEHRSSDTLMLGIKSPVPHADSIAGPGYTLVGNTFGTISLYGTGFVYAGEFLVNGASRPVGGILPGRVVLGLLPEDVDSAGTLDIQYHSFGPGGGTTAILTHQIVAPNPIPAMTAADRTLLVADSGDLTVTFHGQGFLPSGVIELAAGEYDYEPGDTLATTWVSDSVVTAIIPAGRLGEARPYWFRARSPQPTLGPSSSLAINGASPGVRGIRTMTGTILDLTADPTGTQLWAVTSTGAGLGAHYLTAIDPFTATPTDSVLLPNGANRLLSGADGTSLFVLTTTGAVEAYDAATLTQTSSIPLGNTPDGVPWTSYSMAASALDPDRLAVLLTPSGPSSSGIRLVIIDDGVVRPATFQAPHPGTDVTVAFTHGDSGLVMLSQTFPAVGYRLWLSAAGVDSGVVDTLVLLAAGEMAVTGNTVHTSGGESFDLTTGTSLGARNNYPFGLITQGRDPLVAYQFAPSEIVRLGPGSPIGQGPIQFVSPGFNISRRLVRWGSDGFAVAGTGGVLIGRSSETVD